MKKFWVVLLTVCMALTCFSVAVSAEEANEPTKTVTDALVGTFYVEGEHDPGKLANGAAYTSDYNWWISDQLSKALAGTGRFPFYVQNETFAEYTLNNFTNEMQLVHEAGIDYVVYNYYCGDVQFMNKQLNLHKSYYPVVAEIGKVRFAAMIDADFDPAKDTNDLVNNILLMSGYLVNADGIPVVYVKWNDAFAQQTEKITAKFAKAVKDGANEKKKSAYETIYAETIQDVYYVAVDAPDAAAAIAAGADAVTYSEVTGKDNAAYASYTAGIEAKWTKAGTPVVANVSVGYDATPLAANPIKVTAKKYNTKKTEATVRFDRSASANAAVAAPTQDEYMAHLKNAVTFAQAQTSAFKSVIIYAWDDYAGGAALCPKSTSDYGFLKAMRNYFYGTETFSELVSAVVTAAPTSEPAGEEETFSYKKGDEVTVVEGRSLELFNTDGTSAKTLQANEAVTVTNAESDDCIMVTVNGGDGTVYITTAGKLNLAKKPYTPPTWIEANTGTFIAIVIAAVVIIAAVVAVAVVLGGGKKGKKGAKKPAAKKPDAPKTDDQPKA